MSKPTKVMEFMSEFNTLSPFMAEGIMEWLENNDMLSKKGKQFRDNFWDIFIEQEDEKEHQMVTDGI